MAADQCVNLYSFCIFHASSIRGFIMGKTSRKGALRRVTVEQGRLIAGECAQNVCELTRLGNNSLFWLPGRRIQSFKISIMRHKLIKLYKLDEKH